MYSKYGGETRVGWSGCDRILAVMYINLRKVRQEIYAKICPHVFHVIELQPSLRMTSRLHNASEPTF